MKKVFYVAAVASLGIISLALIIGIFILVTCTFDYKTGRDTGYISAVDKKTLTNDVVIYLRRHPLDAQMTYGSAEKDEIEYCTTAGYAEVIEKAYEAMSNNKRVILVYDKPREFGWRKIDGCNEAPITDIRYAEE